MSSRLHTLKAVLGGDLSGGTLTCPTIGHGSKDRGTSITERASAPNGLLVFVHNGTSADALAAKDHVLRILGEEPDYLRRDRDHDDSISNMTRRVARRTAEEQERADIAARQLRALRIWHSGVDPRGTVVERYLASRKLDLTDDLAGDVLRFVPRCPFGQGVTVPAMVAVMCDVLSGETRAIHRTALSDEGQKLGRKMLGPTAGTAIMLGQAGDELAVGEGIESCLSAIQLGYGPGIWAMGSAGAIGRLPVIERVKRLVLLEERDATSANAVSDCGHRWTRAGKAVSVVLPTVGKDLNDSLRGIA